MPEEFKLSNPPSDTISAVEFQPKKSQFLLASSWDCHLYLYDTYSNTRKLKMDYSVPILDCCFGDSNTAYAAGASNGIRSYDCNTGKVGNIVGSHRRAISCLNYVASRSMLVSGSWDTTVGLWDVRMGASTSSNMSANSKNNCISTLKQPGEVYTLDCCESGIGGAPLLVVGTEKRFVYIWDLRKYDQPLQIRESNLKYQTRSIRCFPNGQGYALASIEGRVAVEFFNQDPDVQKKKYAFKCHRLKEGDVEYIHPVNTITFHKEYNTFATGGCDGVVNIWDGFNRKRLVQIPDYPASISALKFADDNSNYLAIASSYTWEDGENGFVADSNIFIRSPAEQEIKPKQLQNK